jgi:hypothetical protein
MRLQNRARLAESNATQQALEIHQCRYLSAALACSTEMDIVCQDIWPQYVGASWFAVILDQPESPHAPKSVIFDPLCEIVCLVLKYCQNNREAGSSR